MKFIRNALAAGFLAAATVVACSSQHGATTGTSSNQGSSPNTVQTDGTGSVGLNLITPSGTSLYSVNYTITNGTNTYPGTVPLGDAAVAGPVAFVVGGIAVGTGYTLTITGTDSAGDVCSGTSAPFAVAASSAAVYVAVGIVCIAPTDAAIAANITTGTIQVEAGVTFDAQAAYQCPGISSFSISPAVAAAGTTVQLSVSQTGATTGTYLWTSTGGTLSSTTSATPTFECLAAGTFGVTVQVQDVVVPLGSDAAVNVCNNVANTTLTGQVVCEATGGCFCPGGEQNCPITGNSCNCVPSPLTSTSNCGACGVTCGGTTPLCTPIAGVYGCHAPPPTPCTAAGQTNCVQCPDSAGGTCSNTEAEFVNLDIAAGLITSNVPDTVTSAAGGCYQCLVGAGCLDFPTHHQTGLECDDLTGTFTDSAGATGTASVLCDAALQCILSSGTPATSCAANADGLSYCYCGAGGGAASVCSAKGTSVNGACLSQLVAGFPYAQSDATDILGNYTSTASPSGVANSILACASGNNCTQCL
jgi:hypothetical protein